MSQLFNRGELSDYLSSRLRSCLGRLEAMHEDEVLARSADDIVAELAEAAYVEPVKVGSDAVDGGVAETKVESYDRFDGRSYMMAGLKIHAVFEYSGSTEVLYYRPSTRILTSFNAEIRSNTITVKTEQAGSTPNPTAAKDAINRQIDQIRTMAGHASTDITAFNATLDTQIRPAVERRKEFFQNRRDLAGALGFPLKKRSDAPAPVPLHRKAMGVSRSSSANPRLPYKD
ncbi:hypothetical protein [Rhodococcus sp. MALMAid1271]|uniref:hypothetical protein n=1 Tax=Rhodococcus sp. MALMAid1271 TaxID=3411744 RepID=UPI003BA0B40F